MTKDSGITEVQCAVANILRQPAEPLMSAVHRLFADRPRDEQGKIFWAAKDIVAQTLPTELAKGSANDVPPVLIDRLKFAWSVVNTAESRVRSIAVAELPTIVDLEFVRERFDGVVAVPTLTDELLNEMCDALKIGPGARFLKTYHQVLKAQKPKRLTMAILDQGGHPNRDNLRRAILWLIRKRRDQYVDPSQKPFDVHFAFLANEVLGALEAWFDANVRQVSSIREEIENSINEWLEYNCLEGDNAPEEDSAKRAIAIAFVKSQKLKDRIVPPQVAQDPVLQKKLRELERENGAYVDENRKLEEDLRRARAKLAEFEAVTTTGNHAPIPTVDSTATQDLKEILKLIDSKYSLDMLHDIQLGSDPAVTMKNFVAHLFYALRKKGLCNYPEDDRFDLAYDQSGLYRCIGFEVQPNTAARVEVVKKGWCIKSHNRVIPIRHAQVKPAGSA